MFVHLFVVITVLSSCTNLLINGRACTDGFVHPCRFVLRALFSNEESECHFPEDMNDFDERMTGSLQWLLDHSIDDLDLEMTFSHEVTCTNGETLQIGLSPSNHVPSHHLHEIVAEEIEVSDANKMEFVQRKMQFLLIESIQDEVEAVRHGFHSVVPEEYLALFFPHEIALILGGRDDLNIQEWIDNTHYSSGYSSSSPPIRWFWLVVNEMALEERSMLLQFCTGSSRLPLGGFSALKGLGDSKQFTIAKGGDVDTLPTASTCFNLLKLPPYKSLGQLRNKLLVAVRFGSTGFTFS
eukprot:m.74701 g.74701  ORF g.74701 m.74701 type:complete len:296 (+) comp8458_c0_seq2:2507-3394(+)